MVNVFYPLVMTIKVVVGAMMGGVQIEEIDNMTRSAISEFCNMIMGNAATNLSYLNKKVNITSPVTIHVDIDVFSKLKFPSLTSWINDRNKFDIYLAIKEENENNHYNI